MTSAHTHIVGLLSLPPDHATVSFRNRAQSSGTSELPAAEISPACLPQQHLDDLDRQLRDHQARLHQLNRKMITLQEEAALHEAAIKMGRDPSVLSALGSLYARPELAAEIAKDPAGFARARGIVIPDGVRIMVADSNAKSVKVEAHFSMGLRALRILWDRNLGFSLEPADRH